jgi:uncharacterized protein involved in exopolysaccharide biosynthesis
MTAVETPASPFPISFTTRDLVLIMFRHRWRMILMFVACIVASGLLSVLLPPVYQSEATVLINKFGREFTFRPGLGAGASPLVPMTSDPEEILNTQVQLLRSRDVVLAVVGQIGLERLYPELVKPGEAPDLDRVVEKFGDAFQAIPQRTSNILRLAFSHRDRELAAATLAAVIETFREKSISVYINTQTQFYQDQVEQARRRFADTDARLTAFRDRHGVLAFEQQKALLLQQRLDFDTEFKRLDAEYAGIAERVTALRGQMDDAPADITAFTDTQPSRVVEDARTKLLNLKLRQQEILTTFAPASRQAQQAAQEIAIAEQFLAQQASRFSGTVRKARNEVLTALEQDLNRALADRASLDGRRREIAARVAEADSQIKAMTAADTERWTLERDVATAQENLKVFTAKLEEARAADALNRSRVDTIAVVQAPSLPDARQPIQPRPLRYVLLGLLAGLFAAVVAAFLSELASDTIYDPVRAERMLFLPTLAVFDLAKK